MVDFQERDTHRGIDDDDGSESNGDRDVDHGDHDRGDDGGDGDHHHGHGGESDHDHDHHAHDVEELGVAVITVSSTRTLDDDPSGDVIAERFESAGHGVATRELVRDEYDRVQQIVKTVVGRGDVDVVVTTGGTGVTPDDVTIEAVEPMLDKRLPGFGELFRHRSLDEIGTRVVATRATAGIADGIPVFCLPGSENAARLGTEEIILPEAGHLVGLARRDS